MKTERQTYRTRHPETVLLGLMSLSVVVSGIFMTQDEPVMGWFITSFFGICLVVFVVQLIPGSTELKLTKEGFEVTSLFRKSMTKWTDVELFKIDYLGRNKTIMFDYIDGHKKHSTGKIISKCLSGSHGALLTTYGLKTTELLMNERINTVHNSKYNLCRGKW